MREGLRERKKRQTREAVAAASRRLFLQRGFEAVTVAAVAAEADVSPATVFNHFRTKEDLFFSGMQVFEEKLIEAVRARPQGESALEAFRRQVMSRAQGLAEPEAVSAIAAAARLLNDTRQLREREFGVLAEQAQVLAEVIRQDVGGSATEPLVAAHALMGLHAALLHLVRSLVLEGVHGDELVRRYSAEAERSFARLSDGLGNYAVRSRPAEASS